MRTRVLLGLVLCLYVSVSYSQNPALWNRVAQTPKTTNGVILLEPKAGLKHWQVVIWKRTYSGNTYSDDIVHREKWTGINSYFVPSRYHEDKESHEYMYQIRGYDSGNQILHDTGVHSVVGDGTPKVLRKTWVCDGYDYAYKVALYTEAGYANGTLIVEGPDYVYEYIRPADIPCDLDPFDPQYIYFVEAHGLDDQWCFFLGQGGGFDFSTIELTNDYQSYYDKYGYLITTPTLYAVQKVNWKWPSGAILADNIADASVFALADIDYVIDYLNQYSNIALVSPDHPVLDCFNYGVPPQGSYSYSDPGSVADCILNGTEYVLTLDEAFAGSEDLPSLVSVISNCQESGGISYLDGLDVVDISDLKNPVFLITYDRDDFMDENEHFTFPSFEMGKGTYWICVRFTNGRFAHFFKTVNERLFNAVEDALLVDFTIFPVPITNDCFSVNVESHTNTSLRYEVFNHAGAPIYSMALKVSPNDDFYFPVDIPEGIPSGNVFHRFVFEDGSIKTINSIK